MTDTELHIDTMATEYTVTATDLPRDDINASHFAITVAYRGADRWTVLRRGFCLGVDGEWDYESIPSERADDWLATHRFDLDTALRLAAAEVPKLRANGWTVHDALNAAQRRQQSA